MLVAEVHTNQGKNGFNQNVKKNLTPTRIKRRRRPSSHSLLHQPASSVSVSPSHQLHQSRKCLVMREKTHSFFRVRNPEKQVTNQFESDRIVVVWELLLVEDELQMLTSMRPFFFD